MTPRIVTTAKMIERLSFFVGVDPALDPADETFITTLDGLRREGNVTTLTGPEVDRLDRLFQDLCL